MEPIKKLYRSRDDKKVSGVCAGLALYLGVDVTIVRVVWLLATLFIAPPTGVLLYILCIFIIPLEPSEYEAYFEEKE